MAYDDENVFVGKNCKIATRYSQWYDVIVISVTARGVLFEDEQKICRGLFGSKTQSRTIFVPMNKIEYIKLITAVK